MYKVLQIYCSAQEFQAPVTDGVFLQTDAAGSRGTWGVLASAQAMPFQLH